MFKTINSPNSSACSHSNERYRSGLLHSPLHTNNQNRDGKNATTRASQAHDGTNKNAQHNDKGHANSPYLIRHFRLG